MPTAAARSAASRITLTRALVALGVVLVAINVASAIWDARTDRDRTELRARRNLSNLSGLLSEQTAAALETVDLVLRDAVRDGTTAKVAAMTPRLRDEMIHIPQVAGFLVIDADGRVVGRTNETRRSITASPGARFSPRTARRAPWGFSSASLTRAVAMARNGASSCRGASTRPAARSAASSRR